MHSLILIYFISHVHSQAAKKDVLGIASCDYTGKLQKLCSVPDLPIEQLPKDCTSYNYMILQTDGNSITDEGAEHSCIDGLLDKLIQTKVNVTVYYYRATQKEWCAAVQCNNTEAQTKELNVLKTYLDAHPGVKGITLCGFLGSGIAPLSTTDCPDYTQGLISFIALLRKTFPDLAVGMVIGAKRAKEIYNDPNLAHLDYKALDPSVDYFMITFGGINHCTDEFLKTGVYPLCGSNNSVEALSTFLCDAGVPSSKTHYTFQLYGEPKTDGINYCDTQPTAYCKVGNYAKAAMCGETIQTLVDKGAFAKQNGAGFVVEKIDSDDFTCVCACDQPFPALHALLNGFNGSPAPPPCALYDRS